MDTVSRKKSFNDIYSVFLFDILSAFIGLPWWLRW